MATDVFTTSEGTESALDTLVGEGKKFATVEELATGKLASDAHITTLEDEAATIKEVLDSKNKEEQEALTVKDIVTALKETNTTPDSTEDKQMSTEELVEQIKSVIKGENATSTREANRDTGNKLVLDKANGDVDVAKVLVAERASKLGLSTDILASLSEESPDAFAKLMEIDITSTQPTIQGLDSVNMQHSGDGATMEVDGHKTKSYFEVKRREMGNLKYLHDKGLQAEIQEASQALGSRYYQ